jgi:glycosyltransferase involved in cell wall biosynthesis
MASAKPYLFLDKMKTSVVIPLYNKEKSILRAINSVLHQSEQDFELIVVNDGSSDQSAALVANLSDHKKIRLINQDNAGVSAARNRGIIEAKSELIAFLDADDEWHPDFLKTILEMKSQFPDGSVFSTLYSVQEQTGELTLPNVAPFFESGYRGFIENYLNVIRSVLPFDSSSFAVTKKAFQEIGGFPVGINFGEDVDTFIRLSMRHKIVYINKSLAIYHCDAENRAGDLYYPSMNEYYPVKNLVQMVRAGEIPKHLRQSAIEYIAKSQLSLANSHLYYGNPRQARELIHSCSGTKIFFKKWIVLYLYTFIPPDILMLLIKIKNISRECI